MPPDAGGPTTCPHCGLRALSAWRKLALGPAAEVRCRACGLAVGAAVGPALVSFVPCAAVIVAVLTRTMREPATMIGAGAAAIAVTCLLYLVWVPLVRRELTRADAVRAAHGDPG